MFLLHNKNPQMSRCWCWLSDSVKLSNTLGVLLTAPVMVSVFQQKEAKRKGV